MNANDYVKFYETVSKLYPNLKKEIEKKTDEDENAKLLQEEQNLTEDLNVAQKALDNVENHMEALRQEFYKEMSRRQNLMMTIHKIKNMRTALHQKWIEKNPAQKSDAHEDSDAIKKMICDVVNLIDALV